MRGVSSAQTEQLTLLGTKELGSLTRKLQNRAAKKEKKLEHLQTEGEESVVQRQQIVGLLCTVLGCDHDAELRLAREHAAPPASEASQQRAAAALAVVVADAAVDAANGWADAARATDSWSEEAAAVEAQYVAAAAAAAHLVARPPPSESAAANAMKLLPVAHLRKIVDRAVASRREKTIEHRDRSSRLKEQIARLGATHAREVERLENQLSFINSSDVDVVAAPASGAGEGDDVDDAEAASATPTSDGDDAAEAETEAEEEAAQKAAVAALEAQLAERRAERETAKSEFTQTQAALLAELEVMDADMAGQAKARDSVAQRLKAATRELEAAEEEVSQRSGSLVRSHARLASARSRHEQQMSAINEKLSASQEESATATAGHDEMSEKLSAARAAGGALQTLRAQYAKQINVLDEQRVVEANLRSQLDTALSVIPLRKRKLARLEAQLESARGESDAMRRSVAAMEERTAVTSARQDEARKNRTAMIEQRQEYRQRLRDTTAKCIDAEVEQRQLEHSLRQREASIATAVERVSALMAEKVRLQGVVEAQTQRAAEHAVQHEALSAEERCHIEEEDALREAASKLVVDHASELEMLHASNAAKSELVESELERHDTEIAAMGKKIAELRDDIDSGRARQRQVIAMAKAQEEREREMVRLRVACPMVPPLSLSPLGSHSSLSPAPLFPATPICTRLICSIVFTKPLERHRKL